MEEIEQLKQTVSTLKSTLVYWQILFWLMVGLCCLQGWWFKKDWRWATRMIKDYERMTSTLLDLHKDALAEAQKWMINYNRMALKFGDSPEEFVERNEEEES